MKYRVETTPRFEKEFRKLDRYTQRMLKAWIDKNLVDCADPRAHGKGLTANRTYHFAKPEYARANQDVLKVVFAELQKTNGWSQANPTQVVELLAPQLKVDPKVLALATERRQYGVVPLTAEIAKDQQLLADAFAKIKLIPKPVEVKDAFLNLPIL